MPDLIAQGPQPDQHWRRRLMDDDQCLLGREAGAWSTPWDEHISRRHVELNYRNGRLRVERLPESLNPVYFQGRPREKFFLKIGEHFVLGSTTFTLTEDEVTISFAGPPPVTEKSYDPLFLKRVRFRRPDQRIAALSELPGLIANATCDRQLCAGVLDVLLAGVPHASAAAVVDIVDQQSTVATSGSVRVLQSDRRLHTGQTFSASEKLIRKSVVSGESVVHTWSGAPNQSNDDFMQSDYTQSDYTQSEDIDWALCTPVVGEACRGWAIYLAGVAPNEDSPKDDLPKNVLPAPIDLRDDVKFTELVASTLGNLKTLRRLERRQAELRPFFSPAVLQTLFDQAPEQDPEKALAPREVDTSVLFCDLRGFSRRAEQMADDLFGLLARVSEALGVTTCHILGHGGVIGDFHGDAAMGFWGWPWPQLDAADRACRAALAIHAEFAAAKAQTPLADFQIGIGLAGGKAVAGRIGTVDQVKVTAFGPVVNRASRLEEMTKTLGAAILLDETISSSIQSLVSSEHDAPPARIRRVAKIIPPGLDTPIMVSELLPPTKETPPISDEHLSAYESALDEFIAGNWSAAIQSLNQAAPEDRVKDFLLSWIANRNQPPPQWDGVIALE